MIEFNGERITNIAPVGIRNVAVSSPKPTTTTRNVPSRDGLLFTRQTYGARTVKVTLDLLEPDIDTRLRLAERINMWLSPRSLVPLRLDHYPGKYLLAICTKQIDVALRDWWEDLAIEFTAYDPFWHANHQNAAPIGQSFFVSGSEPPIWHIELIGTDNLDTPRWTRQPAGQFLELTGSVYPGYLTINSETRTIRNETQNYMPLLTLDSRWFDLQPGANQIDGPGGTIYWRERWL